MNFRSYKWMILLTLLAGTCSYSRLVIASGCMDEFNVKEYYLEPTPVKFQLSGLQIASVTDPTKSTGSTLFYFPNGAYVNFDSRGGSVATVETSLFSEGSYSNQIDGVILSGGSTMGLAASDGVRQVIFKERAGKANSFDFIPSIPGAVVFDYGGRIAPYNDRFIYPNRELGENLMANLSAETFLMGRAGAGITTTVNKIDRARWGGQGIATGRYSYRRRPFTVLSAVVLNSGGDIIKADQSYTAGFQPIGSYRRNNPVIDIPHSGRQNTTLSVVITDLSLDRNQLKRIAIMAHSSMAREIYPFHGSTDGDIMFVVSTGNGPNTDTEDIDGIVAEVAAKLMKNAIYGAVAASNPVFGENINR